MITRSAQGMKTGERRMQKLGTRSTRGVFCLLSFFILPSGFCLPASGQSYSIDWHMVAGGGGGSTSGVYAVSGTIGQPDAGAMSGVKYSLTGGFWSLVSASNRMGS